MHHAVLANSFINLAGDTLTTPILDSTTYSRPPSGKPLPNMSDVPNKPTSPETSAPQPKTTDSEDAKPEPLKLPPCDQCRRRKVKCDGKKVPCERWATAQSHEALLTSYPGVPKASSHARAILRGRNAARRRARAPSLRSSEMSMNTPWYKRAGCRRSTCRRLNCRYLA